MSFPKSSSRDQSLPASHLCAFDIRKAQQGTRKGDTEQETKEGVVMSGPLIDNKTLVPADPPLRGKEAQLVFPTLPMTDVRSLL